MIRPVLVANKCAVNSIERDQDAGGPLLGFTEASFFQGCFTENRFVAALPDDFNGDGRGFQVVQVVI